MTGTEVVPLTPQQELVAQVRGEQFRSQVALALPENVTPERFVRVAITALQANPSVAELERESVFRSLLQSAAMGLLPDGREAAIVPFKGKGQLIPMIAGYRKIAGEYGWTIYTAIAYENDEFEYEQGLEVAFRHRPVRPGRDRGEPIAAYAVGKHTDGRRELEVLTVDEVEKVRATSQTARKEDGPWTQWWEQMAEKTAGKRLFKKLPLSEDDKRVRIIRAAVEPAEAAAAIYGPQARAALAPGETVDPETGEITDTSGADGSPTDGEGRPAAAPADRQVAGAADPTDADASAPPTAPSTPEDEPALESGPSEDEVAELGETKIPKGAAKDSTLAQAAAADTGEAYFRWALAQPEGFWSKSFREKLEAYAKAKGLGA